MNHDVPSPQVLLLPGWQHAASAPWLKLWQTAHGYRLVAQHDGLRPLRGDWMMQLEEAVLISTVASNASAGTAAALPAAGLTLVAHGLGCLLVAAWAAHSRHSHRVNAALLVAPLDVECEALRPLLASWSPIPQQSLAFHSMMVGSRNDPQCSFERARAFADAWGAEFIDGSPSEQSDAASGLGDWPQGQALLQRVQDKAQALPKKRSDVSKAALTAVANSHPDQ